MSEYLCLENTYTSTKKERKKRWPGKKTLDTSNFYFPYIPTGLQKDRDRRSAGPNEGLSPIGRFGLKGKFLKFYFVFKQYIL